MARKFSLILLIAVLVTSLLAALPGCADKSTESDTGSSTTDTGSSTTDTGTTQGSGRPQLLMFTQEGCPPCVPVHETVEELEGEMSGEVDFKVIHAENDFNTFRKYGVQATPTVIILDGSGNVARAFVGGTDKETIKSELQRVL